MFESDPAGRPSIAARVPPLSAAAVLALTAAPWMQKTIEASPTDIQRSYTLWGMLATVSSRYLFLLVLAIALLLAFVVVNIVVRGASPTARNLTGWLAVAAALGIIFNIDSGYWPGAGCVLTLVICVLTAGLTSIASVIRMITDRAAVRADKA